MKIWRKRTQITIEVCEVTTYRTGGRVCEHCGMEMSRAPNESDAVSLIGDAPPLFQAASAGPLVKIDRAETPAIEQASPQH